MVARLSKIPFLLLGADLGHSMTQE
jgi:hypothetical protein